MQPVALTSPREFVAVEQRLRAGAELAGGAATLRELSADEAQHLRTSAAVILALRLRREHPVLARVMSLVHGRLSGERPEALSRRETEALVALTGSLSHGENDLLNHLRSIGGITEQSWSTVVLPHRERSNREQRSRLHALKWGLASFFTSVSPMAVGLGALALATGPVGQIGAALGALLVGLGVAPRLQRLIERRSREENVLTGVDVASGRGVSTEAAMIVDRAARGAVHEAPGGNLLGQLRTELAVCELLLASRRTARLSEQTGESELVPLAARYHRGIAALLEESARDHVPESRLRERLTRLRAETLTPDLLERSARRQLASCDASPERCPEDVIVHGKHDRERLERAGAEAMKALLQQSLPRLGGLTSSLEPEVAEARPLAGGGYELRGHFERGLLRRNTGSWRLRISDTGVVDPRSLLVDVGAGGAAAIAELAARRHLTLSGQQDTVERAEVRRIGTESRPRYVAVVQRRRGERPLRVIVTGFGLVEWEHLLVTPARLPVRRDGGQP